MHYMEAFSMYRLILEVMSLSDHMRHEINCGLYIGIIDLIDDGQLLILGKDLSLRRFCGISGYDQLWL